jgi:hypothetical protein
MKRLALLFLFITSLVHYSLSQIFKGGFYAGASVADVAGMDNIDNDNDFKHLGFTVAGTVSAKISPKTNLQMEIRYIQRGSQQNPPVDSNGFADLSAPFFTLTLRYIDVVLGIKHQIHFNIRNTATDKYGIEAGASIGSLFSYSYTYQNVSYNMALNNIDISPYVGIYYNVTPHFYIEGRYSNSVNSAIVHDNVKNPYFLYYNSWNAGHNLAFTLTLGFVFGKVAQPTGNEPSKTPPPTDSTDN